MSKPFNEPPDTFDEALLRRWVEWVKACPVDAVELPAMFRNVCGLLDALDAEREKVSALRSR